MNREEILKAIDAILDGEPVRVGFESEKPRQYIFVKNPAYDPEFYGEAPALVIDFAVLREIVAERLQA